MLYDYNSGWMMSIKNQGRFNGLQNVSVKSVHPGAII